MQYVPLPPLFSRRFVSKQRTRYVQEFAQEHGTRKHHQAKAHSFRTGQASPFPQGRSARDTTHHCSDRRTMVIPKVTESITLNIVKHSDIHHRTCSGSPTERSATNAPPNRQPYRASATLNHQKPPSSPERPKTSRSTTTLLSPLIHPSFSPPIMHLDKL